MEFSKATRQNSTFFQSLQCYKNGTCTRWRFVLRLYTSHYIAPSCGHLLVTSCHSHAHAAILSRALECNDCYASQCAFKPRCPAPHWKVTIGDPKLTRLNNFRIRLLVGCDGLEADAARFRSRTTTAQPGDPSCKLCNRGVPEDAAHFVSACPALDEERVKLYSDAPPSVRSQIPGVM